jgi:hypothetical protein
VCSYTYLRNTTSNLPQYDRTDCQDVPRQHFDLMGLSVRTDEWRYTEWLLWDGATLAPNWGASAVGVELYDHSSNAVDIDPSDPFSGESVNLVGEPKFAAQVELLSQILRETFGNESPGDRNILST